MLTTIYTSNYMLNNSSTQLLSTIILKLLLTSGVGSMGALDPIDKFHGHGPMEFYTIKCIIIKEIQVTLPNIQSSVIITRSFNRPHPL